MGYFVLTKGDDQVVTVMLIPSKSKLSVRAEMTPLLRDVLHEYHRGLLVPNHRYLYKQTSLLNPKAVERSYRTSHRTP